MAEAKSASAERRESRAAATCAGNDGSEAERVAVLGREVEKPWAEFSIVPPM